MRPLLVYDGDCGFCRRWVKRWQARTGDRVEYRPFQEAGVLDRYRIPLAAARRSVQLVVGGRRYEGADAVGRVLERAPELRSVAWVGRLPVIRALAAWIYRRVANHRTLAAHVDTWLVGRSTEPPTNVLVRSLFLRGLGAVYVIAFTSLRRQVRGLYGERGILPVREYLDAIGGVTEQRWRAVPTVFWLDASDRALVRACTAGQGCGVLLALGVAPRAAAIAAWGLYLSFVSVGREFLSFQWDALLLETGLAAAIVASPRRDENTPWPGVLVLRLLAFRLYFESGLVKLLSGDPTWRSRTACSFHFATQPLPTRIGWHAHQLPKGFHRFATASVLALELVVPWLAFAPRRARRAAFVALSSLQLLIELTGNYGFFNLLTVVDSLWLLDDEPIARVLHAPRPRAQRAPWWRRIATAVFALPVLALAIAEVVGRVRPVRSRVLDAVHDTVGQLRPVSSYGLFAMMTTERPEVVIEGSLDGREWREYRFRYKPVDATTPPRVVAPHQPRLDWQMWFAALRPAPSWFANLLARLLEGSPDVLALLADNPFPERPPTYVRALLYEYRMTDRTTRRRTGEWWHRELRGLYFPPVRAARQEEPMTNEKSRKRDQPARQPPKPRDDLDRSTAGVIETGHDRQKPPPPDAPADRHTTDSRRGR